MRGVGIKMDIMTAKPMLRVLDITRTVSRMGAGHATGVDRVEQAYVRHLVSDETPAVFLAKLRQTYVILKKSHVTELLKNLNNPTKWGPRSFIDILRRRLSKQQQQAQSYVRRLSHAQFSKQEFITWVSNQNYEQIEYLNTGHSNIDIDFFKALKSVPNLKIRVLVHDLIPLDFPQFSRPIITQNFEEKMRCVSAYADEVICNSKYTEDRAKDVFGAYGRIPTTCVAWLGIEPIELKRIITDQPNFVILGTIEPRKNHALLLDVWEKFTATQIPGTIPHLHIIGKRGWQNETVFNRLDTAAYMGKTVFEHSDLRDAEMQTFLSQATAMLFPSHVEGFGLPALEAAQIGLPLICSDIPAFREILTGGTTFLPPNEPEIWAEEILKVANISNMKLPVEKPIENRQYIPKWESHFGHVFRSK